tara:strand:- start:280 stop:777 length:498 start_codon:yes stop_codon:yes gene_type:complete
MSTSYKPNESYFHGIHHMGEPMDPGADATHSEVLGGRPPAHSPDAPWVEENIKYKFNEENLINEIKRYVDKTYSGHYSKNQFQSSEFIMDCGHGMGFFLGNVLKYAQRYGKKDGNNRADILKIIHYGLLALNCHDENEKKRPMTRQEQLELDLPGWSSTKLNKII